MDWEPVSGCRRLPVGESDVVGVVVVVVVVGAAAHQLNSLGSSHGLCFRDCKGRMTDVSHPCVSCKKVFR